MEHEGGRGDDELLKVVTKIRVMFYNDSNPDSDACDTKNVQTILKTEGCVGKFVELLERNDELDLQVCVTINSCSKRSVYEGL